MTRARTFVGIAFTLLSVASATAEDFTFNVPRHNGYRLDVCRTWGQGCGQAAADAFCRINGYERAISFEIDPKIGAVSPTMTLGDQRVCDQPQCDGFRWITCTRPGSGPPPARSRGTPPPAASGAPPVAPVSPGLLGAIKKVGPAAPKSSVPEPSSPAEPPPPAGPPAAPKEEPNEPPPPPPDPGTPASPSAVPPPGDPDELVVVFPRQANGWLGRFGSRAAAGQLEEDRPVPLKVKADMFQAEPGDFDGDGQAEIALLERPDVKNLGKGEVSFLRYTAAAGFTPHGKSVPVQYGSGMPFLTVGRLLGTGHHEALLYSPGGAAVVLSTNPGAEMVPVRWNPKGVLVPIDATGDGVDEVLDYTEPAGTLDLVGFEFSGPDAEGARHLDPIIRPLPALGPGRRFAVGDFTGDLRPDLLIHDSTTGDVSLAQFTPKGGIAKMSKVDSGWTATSMWTAGRDYDGDKRDDLLVYDPPAGQVWLVRFTDAGVLRDKRKVSTMQAGSLLYPGAFTGTGRASYVAMARDENNKLVHVQFDPSGKPRNDGTLIHQLPDGGIVVAGNFVKDR